MEFTQIQLLLIAAAANAIVWLVRILGAKVNFYPKREVLVVVMYLTALGLGAYFADLALPTGGLEDWLAYFTVSLAPIVAVAWAIYQLIAKRVFDGIENKFAALNFRA